MCNDRNLRKSETPCRHDIKDHDPPAPGILKLDPIFTAIIMEDFLIDSPETFWATMKSVFNLKTLALPSSSPISRVCTLCGLYASPPSSQSIRS